MQLLRRIRRNKVVDGILTLPLPCKALLLYLFHFREGPRSRRSCGSNRSGVEYTQGQPFSQSNIVDRPYMAHRKPSQEEGEHKGSHFYRRVLYLVYMSQATV